MRLAVEWRPYSVGYDLAQCAVVGYKLQSHRVLLPQRCDVSHHSCGYFVITPGWEVDVTLLKRVSKHTHGEVLHLRNGISFDTPPAWRSLALPALHPTGKPENAGNIVHGACAGQTWQTLEETRELCHSRGHLWMQTLELGKTYACHAEGTGSPRVYFDVRKPASIYMVSLVALLVAAGSLVVAGHCVMVIGVRLLQRKRELREERERHESRLSDAHRASEHRPKRAGQGEAHTCARAGGFGLTGSFASLAAAYDGRPPLGGPLLDADDGASVGGQTELSNSDSMLASSVRSVRTASTANATCRSACSAEGERLGGRTGGSKGGVLASSPCGASPCGASPCGASPCGASPCGASPCGSSLPKSAAASHARLKDAVRAPHQPTSSSVLSKLLGYNSPRREALLADAANGLDRSRHGQKHGRADADAEVGGSAHGGSMYGGSVHGGSVHGGSVHGGSVHGGAQSSGSRQQQQTQQGPDLL